MVIRSGKVDETEYFWRINTLKESVLKNKLPHNLRSIFLEIAEIFSIIDSLLTGIQKNSRLYQITYDFLDACFNLVECIVRTEQLENDLFREVKNKGQKPRSEINSIFWYEDIEEKYAKKVVQIAEKIENEIKTKKGIIVSPWDNKKKEELSQITELIQNLLERLRYIEAYLRKRNAKLNRRIGAAA